MLIPLLIKSSFSYPLVSALTYDMTFIEPMYYDKADVIYLPIDHSGLQQSARPNIRVSVGDETSRLLRRLECLA